MLFSKKSAAILIAFAIFISYEFNKIKISDKFENPVLYKSSAYLMVIFARIAKLGAALNFGSDISIFRNLLSSLNIILKQNHAENEFANVIDKTFNGVKVRVYSPKLSNTNNKPVMLYYHGGAYSLGDIDTYDLYLIEFVKRLNMVVVSVDYRYSPEFPYPAQIDDCYWATKYVIKNANEFGVDTSRMIVSGDSAGGNAAAVIAQKLLNDKLQTPKLQILLYPWLQMFNFLLPSCIEYGRNGILAGILTAGTASSWYLGIEKVSSELEWGIIMNNHTALLVDQSKRQKLLSYLDIKNIPDEYKVGKSYYKDYEEVWQKIVYPDKLDEDNVLLRNKEYSGLFAKLFEPGCSPLFAEDEIIQKLPNTYFVVFERDTLKDEALLYAERLRKAGVPVKVAFYEDAFHGIASMVHEVYGYKMARDMQNDLIKYIEENL